MKKITFEEYCTYLETLTRQELQARTGLGQSVELFRMSKEELQEYLTEKFRNHYPKTPEKSTHVAYLQIPRAEYAQLVLAAQNYADNNPDPALDTVMVIAQRRLQRA